MLIDLSHPIEAEMPVYPGDEPVGLKQCRDLVKDHYVAYYWQTGLHAGTHADAPMHLLAGGGDVLSMPLEHFFAPGVLLENGVDVPEKDIPEGAAVLIDLGAEHLYGAAEYYTDHGCVSRELCDYLMEKKVCLMGVNAPSPDHPPFPIHKALLGVGIPILENLTNLQQLKGRKFTVIALPLAIRAEGSPVRAAAWIQDEDDAE